jgi:hypothetical protein
MSDQIRRALNRIGQFLNRLARTAEQLSIEAVWAIILSVAFVKWLRGRALDPVVEGDQMLLQLLALVLHRQLCRELIRSSSRQSSRNS